MQAGSSSALKNWCAKRERPRVEVEEQQKTMIKEDPNVFRYDEHLDSDDEGRKLRLHYMILHVSSDSSTKVSK